MSAHDEVSDHSIQMANRYSLETSVSIRLGGSDGDNDRERVLGVQGGDLLDGRNCFVWFDFNWVSLRRAKGQQKHRLLLTNNGLERSRSTLGGGVRISRNHLDPKLHPNPSLGFEHSWSVNKHLQDKGDENRENDGNLGWPYGSE